VCLLRGLDSERGIFDIVVDDVALRDVGGQRDETGGSPGSEVVHEAGADQVPRTGNRSC
jgi:hypothetical protein